MSKTKDESSDLPAAKPPKKNAPLLTAACIALAAWIAYLVYLIVVLR